MFCIPSSSDLRRTAAIFALFCLTAASFGIGTGLLSPQAAPIGALIRTALVAFFLPSLLEEVIFRGPILLARRRLEKLTLTALCGVLLIAFIAWHPLNGYFFLTEAQDLFSDWRFLILAGLLGLGATYLTLAARTLWPAIIFHWAAVVLWKAFFGGPNFF